MVGGRVEEEEEEEEVEEEAIYELSDCLFPRM